VAEDEGLIALAGRWVLLALLRDQAANEDEIKGLRALTVSGSTSTR
jgi:hypothetical protein